MIAGGIILCCTVLWLNHNCWKIKTHFFICLPRVDTNQKLHTSFSILECSTPQCSTHILQRTNWDMSNIFLKSVLTFALTGSPVVTSFFLTSTSSEVAIVYSVLRRCCLYNMSCASSREDLHVCLLSKAAVPVSDVLNTWCGSVYFLQPRDQTSAKAKSGEIRLHNVTHNFFSSLPQCRFGTAKICQPNIKCWCQNNCITAMVKR